jgi:dihydroorotate dehydrogenase
MGLYRSVGRPLLFALPPEMAHRLIGSILQLPLPWAAIGDVPDDARLRRKLAGISLRNPVGLAAGFDKSARFLRGLSSLGFGYVVVGTVTRRPRRGNPSPRIQRYPRRESMVNAMGLPNRGPEYVVRRLARVRRRSAIMVSLADEDAPDVLESYALLEPVVDGFELNASCPNVSWGRNRDEERHVDSLVRAIRDRRTAARPLFVKLPPFGTPAEREAVLALARVVQEAGADGLTCSNTRPVAEPRLATRRGGLSGRALMADTPRIVSEVRAATGKEMAVNACGGIITPADALACLEAGAATVQIYTGLIYQGPRMVRDLARGLLGAHAPASPAVREGALPAPLDAPAGSAIAG